MNIIKNIINSKEDGIILTNDKRDCFKIHFGGSDLYWTMLNYRDNNEFNITKENEELFEEFNNLFSKIEEYDNEYCKLVNNNQFEWVSEARQEEKSSKLVITKNEDGFSIQFIRNPNDIIAQFQNVCPICFCMSGSRNQNIAYLFSSKFIEYVNKDKSKQKIYTKNKH